LRNVAKQYADELFNTKIYNSSNLIIIDTTSTADKMVSKIKELKEQDFMVSVLYLDINLDLAIKRDIHRGKTLGRKVGDDIISQYDVLIRNSIEQYKKLAKTDKLIDRILTFEYEHKSGNTKQEYKKIKESIKNEIVSFLNERVAPHYTIYVDLDGVLVDFERQLYDKTGIDDFETFVQQHGENLIWDKISKHGVEFWSEMAWLDGGEELWDYVKKYNPIILSAPKDKNSKIGKIRWIKKYLGDVPYILVPAKEKQNYSNNNSILIDDYSRNIRQWQDKNGIAIHHKNLNDTLSQLKQLGV
jgi:predicted ABC-type ATPase